MKIQRQQDNIQIIQSSVLLSTCILYLVEFQFIRYNIMHMISLCFFSISSALYVPPILSQLFIKYEGFNASANKEGSLFLCKLVAMPLTVIAIGLIIWSSFWLAGVLYFISMVISVCVIVSYFNMCPTVEEPRVIK